MSTAPFSEDTLNRYRIAHPDRDLKPLLRRLHRTPVPSTSGDDSSLEAHLLHLELLKWKSTIERITGSVANLDRQKEEYTRQAEGLRKKTEGMKEVLEGEKKELERARMNRDHRARCNELASRIKSRGRGRDELDAEISTVQTSLDEQRASHGIYAQAAQARADTFTQISKLVEECRGIKLPVDPTLAAVAVEKEDPPTIITSTPINVTSSAPSSSGPPASGAAPKLSANAPIFHPPAKFSVPSHELPNRPSASPISSASNGRNSARPPSYSLPHRPSGMRTSSTPAGAGNGKRGGGLEDGEVGEEGELSERSNSGGGGKRGREGDGGGKRSTRRRRD
ncbi:hypothetical protein B9479_000043 [Cryptococcus floricola]|uniref:Uncharacterized protein n=1 Tax=Cryptococcus floricola TaxID=2591691 RepID=A0A5D3B8A4_9TREE|nr:hypothetical protein B9479_000043 [Cryptococcus floricola]